MAKKDNKETREEREMRKVITRGETVEVIKSAMEPFIKAQDQAWEQQRLLLVQILTIAEVLKQKGVITQKELEDQAGVVVKNMYSVAEGIMEEESDEKEEQK